MKYILPSYLLKELFKTFIPALCGFGFLIILGLTIQLLHKGLDIIDIRAIIPYLMLYACPDALPVAFLAAIVLSYGRLSGTNELVAIRTSGVHLHVIITPVIIVSFLLSFLTLYLNAEVLPKSNRKIKMLKETAVSSVLSRHISAVKKKIVCEPYHIYIGKIDNDTYKNLAIIEYVKDFVTNILLADEGSILMSEDGNSLILTLRNGEFAKMNYQKPSEIPMVGSFDEMSFDIPLNKDVATTSKKYMTLFELYNERKELSSMLEEYTAKLKAEGGDDMPVDIRGKLKNLTAQRKSLTQKQQAVNREIIRLTNGINLKNSEVEKIKNRILTIDNRIALENINLEKLNRTKKKEDRDIISGMDSDIDKANDAIKDYLRKKKTLKNKIAELGVAVKNEEDALQTANARADKLKEIFAVLEKNESTLAIYSEPAVMQKKIAARTTLIHKRLSSSFLCITFALIGIPLGILTKSGNVLISFGVSFILVILVHYPLSVVGQILSKEMLPIAPAIWGSNGIITIMGLVLFRKSLTK